MEIVNLSTTIDIFLFRQPTLNFSIFTFGAFIYTRIVIDT